MEQVAAQERPRRGRPPVSGLADRRRQEIVDAAFAAFADNGYEQTSMADIAARAGMGQGTVYRYVDSKREVLDLVFDHSVERLFDTLAADELLDVVGGFGGPEHRNDIIVEVGKRLYELIDREPELLKLITFQSVVVDKELKQRVIGIQDLLDMYVRRALDRGREAGWIPAESPDEAVLTRLLPALVLPGFVQSLRGHDNPGTRQRFVNSASLIATRGILCADPAESAGRATIEPNEPAPLRTSPVTNDRRNELLDAALERFLRDGYHAVGVDEVVEQLGVSHGTFYNYFESKRDLLDALIVREFSSLESALPQVGTRIPNVADIESTLTQGFQRALEAVADRLPALTFVCIEAAGVDTESLNEVIQFFRYVAVRCEQYVYSMIGADRIDPEIDSEFLGHAFASLLAGALTLVVGDQRDVESIGRTAQVIARFLLYGVNLRE